jgi:hypothetical protein
MNKIAFIFLIYNVINHEDIWYNFFKNIDKNKYSIYIHYKSDEKLKYFEEYKIKDIIKTKYADISIVTAQNNVLKIALQDLNNTNFIFLSGSCIPLKPFNYIYETIEPLYSYFHIADAEESLPDCYDTLKYIERKYLKKASQWCILNRKHSNMLVYYGILNYSNSQLNYIKWFHNAYAPDELCYLTFLAYIYSNNLYNEIIATYYHEPPEKATTFANWEGMNYKYVSDNELKNYIYINECELKHLLYSPCLFGRKFKPAAKISLNKNFYTNYIYS